MTDTDGLVDFIVSLFAYSQLARIRGLLYLEEKLADMQPAFFQESIELVVSGTEPSEVDAFCRKCISKAENVDEKLFREIGRVGVLGILSGEPSISLWVTLAQMIGPEGIDLVKKRLIEFERQKSLYFDQLTQVLVNKALTEKLKEICIEEFVFMTGSVIILVDSFTLTTALKSCSPSFQCRILQNLPLYEMRDCMQLSSREALSHVEIESAIREIIDVYERTK